jgi:hypothetical protein
MRARCECNPAPVPACPDAHIAEERGLTLAGEARLFAMLDLAAAEALIN